MFRRLASMLCTLAALATGCTSSGDLPASPSSADPAKAQAVMKIVRDTMAQAHLRAVIVRVTVDGKEIVTQAAGDSMTGAPATTSMFFRNGAVAISYLSTLLLKLVDEKRVRLDDKLSTWLPDIPNANRVTLAQLAQMTSGYRDYAIGNADFDAARDRRSVRNG
ncbi:beta-lactamase family protein, partial [Mycolicibacterium vaccae]|nr:beta-lactamase family protein [Mycolicibacterium vaccae]